MVTMHWRVLASALLTSFKEGPDGAIQSRGLSVITGQELRIEPEVEPDMQSAHRLAIRLTSQLILREPMSHAEAITAPDGGTLKLEPSPNGRFIRVWRS